MKVFRYISLILVTIVYVSCSGTSEEQLIGDWDKRSVLPTTQRSFAASFVIGDVGYVVGGFNTNNPPLTDVIAFVHNEGSRVDNDPTRTLGRWVRGLSDYEVETEMKMLPRQQAVGFSVGGFGYVGSGWVWTRIPREGRDDYATSNDFWQYDPTADSWKEIAPLPGRPRRGAFAFTLSVGGKEYGFVGGGYTDRHGFDYSVNIYEPNNRLRSEYLNDLWRYDPEGSTTVTRIRRDGEADITETVTLPGSWEEIDDAHFEKRFGAVAFVINNKAYICNGENPTLINDFWEYDPNNPNPSVVWRRLRTMNKVHPDDSYDEEYRALGRTHGVAFVVRVPERNNSLTAHIVGGRQSPNASTNWEYDEIEDLWTQRTRLVNNQTSLVRQGMVSFSFPSTGRAFVGLGQSGSAYFDDMWEFIPWVEDNIYRDAQ